MYLGGVIRLLYLAAYAALAALGEALVARPGLLWLRGQGLLRAALPWDVPLGGLAQDANAAAAGFFDFFVDAFHGRGDDDQIDAFEMRRVVSDGDVDAARGKEFGGCALFQIASRHRDPRFRQDPGDATHSDPANADEMNGPNLIKIHSDLIS